MDDLGIHKTFLKICLGLLLLVLAACAPQLAYNPVQTNPDQLVAAIQRAGYRARR